MAGGQLTRREFLIVGGTVAAGTLAAGPAAGLSAPQGLLPARTAFLLSARGRRASKAAKLHNANWRFATREAADQHRAHPGDRSRIVSILISDDEYDRLFTSPNRLMADLRKLGGPVRLGDCNRNGVIGIEELVRGVNIALGRAPVDECTPFDRNADGRVTVDELVRGVRNALGG